MSYVIQKTEFPYNYVAKSGRKHSYTHTLANARTFETREEAGKEKSGNERVVARWKAING